MLSLHLPYLAHRDYRRPELLPTKINISDNSPKLASWLLLCSPEGPGINPGISAVEITSYNNICSRNNELTTISAVEITSYNNICSRNNELQQSSFIYTVEITRYNNICSRNNELQQSSFIYPD
jgi:hypothetical protein